MSMRSWLWTGEPPPNPASTGKEGTLFYEWPEYYELLSPARNHISGMERSEAANTYLTFYYRVQPDKRWSISACWDHHFDLINEALTHPAWAGRSWKAVEEDWPTFAKVWRFGLDPQSYEVGLLRYPDGEPPEPRWTLTSFFGPMELSDVNELFAGAPLAAQERLIPLNLEILKEVGDKPNHIPSALGEFVVGSKPTSGGQPSGGIIGEGPSGGVGSGSVSGGDPVATGTEPSQQPEAGAATGEISAAAQAALASAERTSNLAITDQVPIEAIPVWPRTEFMPFVWDPSDDAPSLAYSAARMRRLDEAIELEFDVPGKSPLLISGYAYLGIGFPQGATRSFVLTSSLLNAPRALMERPPNDPLRAKFVSACPRIAALLGMHQVSVGGIEVHDVWYRRSDDDSLESNVYTEQPPAIGTTLPAWSIVQATQTLAAVFELAFEWMAFSESTDLDGELLEASNPTNRLTLADIAKGAQYLGQIADGIAKVVGAISAITGG